MSHISILNVAIEEWVTYEYQEPYFFAQELHPSGVHNVNYVQLRKQM